jgi:predicted nucleic acid-binding protein
MTVLIDSSAIIELLIDGPRAAWVVEQLTALGNEELAINPLIYAEVSVPYQSPEDLDGDLGTLAFARLNLPWEAAFSAGKAFELYRGRGGTRTSPMPDFYIGAHAATAGLRLLTLDKGNYGNYFPGVALIAP